MSFNAYVIAALKRRVVARASAQTCSQTASASRAMGHLGAVLAMFEPDVDLAAIRVIRPYKPARGRWNRTALEILRKANHPLKAFELARLSLCQGVPPDRATLYSIGYSCRRCWRGWSAGASSWHDGKAATVGDSAVTTTPRGPATIASTPDTEASRFQHLATS